MSVTVTDSIYCIDKLYLYMNIRAVLAARQIVTQHSRITQIVIYLRLIELDLEDFAHRFSCNISNGLLAARSEDADLAA